MAQIPDDQKKNDQEGKPGGDEKKNNQEGKPGIVGGAVYESDEKENQLCIVGGGQQMIAELLADIDETLEAPGIKWGVSSPREDIGRNYDLLVFIDENGVLKYQEPLSNIKGYQYIDDAFVKKHLAPAGGNYKFYSPFTYEEVSYEELQKCHLQAVYLGEEMSGNVETAKKLFPLLPKEQICEFLSGVLDNGTLSGGVLDLFTRFIDSKYEKWTYNTKIKKDKQDDGVGFDDDDFGPDDGVEFDDDGQDDFDDDTQNDFGDD